MWVKKRDNARFVVKNSRKNFKISETKSANTYKSILCMAEYRVVYFAV